MSKMLVDLKKCLQCGVSFRPRRAHTLTCSNLCRLRKKRKKPPTVPDKPAGYQNVGIPPVRNPKKGILTTRNGMPVQVKLKVKADKPEWASKAYLGKKKTTRKPASKRK